MGGAAGCRRPSRRRYRFAARLPHPPAAASALSPCGHASPSRRLPTYYPWPPQKEAEPSYELPSADEPPTPAVEYRTSQDGVGGSRTACGKAQGDGDGAPASSNGAEEQASAAAPVPGVSAAAPKSVPVTPGGARDLAASGREGSLPGVGASTVADSAATNGDEPAIARPAGSRRRTRVPFCVAGSIGMLHSRGDLNDG
jgi:hypothetical protein